MNRNRLNLEIGLFWLAFLLALAVRLVKLGSLPLTNAESSLALQSLEIARGGHPVLLAQPGYIVLTSLLFFISAATEFTARFWPAVVGSLIVWTPFVCRRQFGQTAALILAFGLAFDPGLVALSRQAGGEIFAIVFLLLAIVLFLNRQMLLAGICAGLAILGGVGLWVIIVPLVLAFGWTRFMTVPEDPDPDQPEAAEAAPVQPPVPSPALVPWRIFVYGLAGALFFIGTLFFSVPNGLSASITAIPQYFSSWTRSSGVPGGLILMTLISYETLPLLFGMAGIVRSFMPGNKIDAFLARWAFLAFIFVFIYPSHLVVHLTWVVIPLWGLTARFLADRYKEVLDEPLIQLGYVTLLVIPLFLAWYNFLNFANNDLQPLDVQNRLIVMIGGTVMVALIAILVWWGWGARHAGHGFITALVILLAVYTFGMCWNAAGLGRRPLVEAWWKSPQIDQAGLFMDTLSNFEEWDSVRLKTLDVVVAGIDQPSLHWVLRNLPNVTFTRDIPAGTAPSILITPNAENMQLASQYSGQDFNWERQPSWTLLANLEWARWIASRTAPMQAQSIILWVRSDLMPGALTGTGQ